MHVCRSEKIDYRTGRCTMKPRDPNRSVSVRVVDMSSAGDGVAELLIGGDGAAETIDPTHVFPTDDAN